MNYHWSKIFILIILLVTNLNYSQSITGEQGEIKESVISSNEVTTLLFNYGSFCAPNTLSNIADMVWKEVGYVFEFGPLISAEVIGENGDTLHITSDSFVRTFQGDYNPDETKKWGWLPREGYSNPSSSEIANSLNNESWPSSWSSWPGEYGEGVVIAENEVFYVMDDFSNAEFSYYPFPDDITKRGIGVSAEVRVYQFGGYLKDALIIKYKITNESPKDLAKVYFGFHGDPMVGGSSDFGDDRVGFLPNDYEVKAAANTIYNYDDDGIGYGGKSTGIISFKLLNTPNNLGLTSFNVANYTNSLPNVPMNDPLIWEWISAESIDENQPLLNEAGDNIITFGSGPFELKSGEYTEIELAIFLSDDLDDMLQDAIFIQHYINWPTISNEYDASGGNDNYKIELNELPNENEGNVEVSWNYTGGNQNTKVFIDYSMNGGKDWMPLVTDQSVNDNYIWDTKLVDDGMNYMLRIIAYNSDNPKEFYYDNSDERFTINNPEKNAVPEFQLIEFSDIIRESTTSINWISEDADNSELIITVEHSINPDDSFQKIYESTHSNGNNSFYWDLSLIPNYDENYLRFSCKDDQNETVFRTSKFVVNIEKGLYSSSHVEHISGKSTPKIEVIVVEPEMITNDDYEITFNVEEEINRYSVQNLTTSEILIDNFELINGMSSTTFEGLRLSIEDNGINIDYELTHFNRGDLEATYNIYFSLSNRDYVGDPHVKSAIDWIVAFNDLDTTSDGSWINIGDSTLFVPSMNDGICPFRIIDIDNNEKANYLIDKSNNSTSIQSQWHEDDIIILRPQDASDATVSYALEFDFSSGDYPQKDDTLYIVTYNPIENVDVFRFQADSNYVLSNEDNSIIPIVYTLSQNYPNPFNPSTTIKYSIPNVETTRRVAFTKLTVFDILGREVTLLVNKEQQPGNYEIEFNANHLSSGIYFYTLKAGSFLQTKKMILLK